MASRGLSETDKLRDNLQEQLCRLVSQLKDLEEIRNEIDDNEYEDMKVETITQMKEFEESLKNIVDGNVTLVNDLNAMQLAIRAAISNAFTIPEVICMFGKKQHNELRTSLIELDIGFSHGKFSVAEYNMRKAEILTALQKLNHTLSSEEYDFLQANSSARLKEFEMACDSAGSIDKAICLAGSDVSSHSK